MRDNPFSENLFDAAKFDLVQIEEKVKILFGVASITEFLGASDVSLKELFSLARKEERRREEEEKQKQEELKNNTNADQPDSAEAEVQDFPKDYYKELDNELIAASKNVKALRKPDLILVYQQKAMAYFAYDGTPKPVLSDYTSSTIRKEAYDFFRGFTEEICPRKNAAPNKLLQLYLRKGKSPLAFNLIYNDSLDALSDDEALRIGTEHTPSSETDTRANSFWLKMQFLRSVWTDGEKTKKEDGHIKRSPKFTNCVFENDYYRTINIMINLLPLITSSDMPKGKTLYQEEVEFVENCFENYRTRKNLKLLPYQLNPITSADFPKELSDCFKRLENFKGADEAFLQRIHVWVTAQQKDILYFASVFEQQLNMERTRRISQKPAKETEVFTDSDRALYFRIIDKILEAYANPVKHQKGNISV